MTSHSIFGGVNIVDAKNIPGCNIFLSWVENFYLHFGDPF